MRKADVVLPLLRNVDVENAGEIPQATGESLRFASVLD